MHMTWNDPHDRRYKKGDLYAGVSLEHGFEVGVTSERHALTVATSGAGKGAGVIIPNLLRWPRSALVIDPKGEAAEATAEAREAMGQSVHVLDPFGRCNVPARFKARFNPLDEIDLDSADATADILNLADGIVVKHDAKSGHWDSGGKGLLAGLIAAACQLGEGDGRTLQMVDLQLGHADQSFWENMAELETVGDLSSKAAARMLKTSSEAAHFASVVRENTSWLSDPAIASVMGESTFRLSDLKNDNTTVYLVLPADYIRTYAGFFRVFVMAAIKAMAKPGSKGRCLFLLDEFFALGHIDEIAVSAGLMRGYGVHLWPFLQDLGQLFELYGQNGAQGFIDNADLLQFFGVGTGITADFVSRKLGVVDLSEVDEPPTGITDWDILLGVMNMAGNVPPIKKNHKYDGFSKGASATAFGVAQFFSTLDKQEKDKYYHHQMRLVGSPRVSPDEVRTLTGKHDSPLASAQIVFIKNAPYLLGLHPWFVKEKIKNQDEPPSESIEQHDTSEPASTASSNVSTRSRAISLNINWWRFVGSGFFIIWSVVNLLWYLDFELSSDLVFFSYVGLVMGIVIYAASLDFD